jgi:hypothetical protein
MDDKLTLNDGPTTGRVPKVLLHIDCENYEERLRKLDILENENKELCSKILEQKNRIKQLENYNISRDRIEKANVLLATEHFDKRIDILEIFILEKVDELEKRINKLGEK